MRTQLSFFISGLLSMLILVSAESRGQTTEKFLPLPEGQVAFSSKDGRRLLAASHHQEAFWKLSQFFNTQQDLGSCGVATSVTVLNALDVPRPQSVMHGEYKIFTAENIFSKSVQEYLTPDKVSRSGMTLEQLAKLLETHNADVTLNHGSESSLNLFRDHLKKHLAKNTHFVVINYLRSAVGQNSGGHISPIGAYSDSRDMVLIMDTSSYKYPWTWVATESVWDAMRQGRDSESKKSRGYLLIRAK